MGSVLPAVERHARNEQRRRLRLQFYRHLCELCLFSAPRLTTPGRPRLACVQQMSFESEFSPTSYQTRREQPRMPKRSCHQALKNRSNS